jgi:hypothetical protein
VEECTHLEKSEQKQLLKLLQKYEDLFDGSLVPHSQEKRLKDAIKRLCEYGVLREINHSEWACPMFTISKPDGSLRFLADLREIR